MRISIALRIGLTRGVEIVRPNWVTSTPSSAARAGPRPWRSWPDSMGNDASGRRASPALRQPGRTPRDRGRSDEELRPRGHPAPCPRRALAHEAPLRVARDVPEGGTDLVE